MSGKRAGKGMTAIAEVIFVDDRNPNLNTGSGRKKLCFKCGNKNLQFLSAGREEMKTMTLTGLLAKRLKDLGVT